MADLVGELEGKVAIVTGSARNIGRATVLELARAGASLVINARQAKGLCEEVALSALSDRYAMARQSGPTGYSQEGCF